MGQKWNQSSLKKFKSLFILYYNPKGYNKLYFGVEWISNSTYFFSEELEDFNVYECVKVE